MDAGTQYYLELWRGAQSAPHSPYIGSTFGAAQCAPPTIAWGPHGPLPNPLGWSTPPSFILPSAHSEWEKCEGYYQRQTEL